MTIDIELMKTHLVSEVNGELLVLEKGVVPFDVCRTFVVTADRNQQRGDHAHKSCTQFLVAIKGEIEISIVDRRPGAARDSVVHLSSPEVGILIPPMVWASQRYLEDRSILIVACDQQFKESDYLRDFKDYDAECSLLVAGESDVTNCAPGIS